MMTPKTPKRRFYRYFRLCVFLQIITDKNCFCICFSCPAAQNYMNGYPRSINYGRGGYIDWIFLLSPATESVNWVTHRWSLLSASNIFHLHFTPGMKSWWYPWRLLRGRRRGRKLITSSKQPKRKKSFSEKEMNWTRRSERLRRRSGENYDKKCSN